jgi:SAM-dependent methyltransferase
VSSARAEESVSLEACPVCAASPLRTLAPPVMRRIFVTDGPAMTARMGVCACAACGLVVLSPRLSTASLGEYYSRQSRMPRESIAPESPIARMMDAQVELIVAHQALGPESSVLEIGCAEGYFLERVAQRVPGVRLAGIEPSARYARTARARLADAEIHEQILDESAFEAFGTHDLIVLRHVLEHLPRPLDDLKLIRRMLSESGVIYIEVPDVADIPPGMYHYFHHEHLTYFSSETLESCLARAGFEVVVLERFPGYDAGSGFAYPVLRVLAKRGKPAAPRLHPQQPDEVWRIFMANEARVLREYLEPAKAKLDAASAAGKRLAIFGAGPHTVDVLGRLEPVKYPWIVAFDNHPGKAGKSICGIPIVAPSPEAFAGVDTVLVSSHEFEPEMIEQMRRIAGERLEIIPLYAAEHASERRSAPMSADD